MRIGIIGSGVVGQQLGIGFIRLGHEVMVGTRDTSKLKEWQGKTDNKGKTGSFEEAAKFGDTVILATKWEGTKNALEIAGKNNLSGKVIIDVTNPLDFSSGMPPKFAAQPGNSGGEQIQRYLSDSKVVKAFNIINAYTMINPQLEEGKADLFIAGNDPDSKNMVTSFAKDLGWENIYDLGDISQSLYLETLTMIWVNYGVKNNSWSHAFKLLKK